MKNTMVILLAAVLAIGLSAIGCGDDDSNGNGTPDTGVTDTTAEVTDDTVEDEPVEGEACTNAADFAIARGTDPDVQGEAVSCGLACASDPDPGACSVPCIMTNTGLSQGCSICYAQLVGCTAEHCMADCFADPASEACQICQATAGCYTAFYACSGLTPPDSN